MSEVKLKKIDIYSLYVDKKGNLRIVMEVIDNKKVRGVNLFDMTFTGLVINDDLDIFFTGYNCLSVINTLKLK